MTPIQQLMLGGGGKIQTYIDDLYQQKVYNGNYQTGHDVVTGLNYTDGEGALITKNIDNTSRNFEIWDTVRGNAKKLSITGSGSAESTDTTKVTTLNSNGFTVGQSNNVNQVNNLHGSWGFKKQEGFFDCLEYSGTGVAKTVSHSLGCKPGMIWIKQKDGTENWRVYHFSLSAERHMILNSNAARASSSASWNNVEPTASVFTVGTDNTVNQDTKTYIAYLFAYGGGPTYAGTFGTNRQIYHADHSDLAVGTSSACYECFIKCTAGFSDYPVVFDTRDNQSSNTGIVLYFLTTGVPAIYSGSTNMCNTGAALSADTWYHIAVTKSGSSIKIWVDGNLHSGTGTLPNNNLSDDSIKIGAINDASNSQVFGGQISNFRMMKGNDRYYDQFGAPTAPLTYDADTVFLCLNHKDPLKGSIIPNALTQVFTGLNSGVEMTYATDVGYTAANKFGPEEDQSLIAMGEYFGNGNASRKPEINIGWEPQLVMVKQSDSTDGWFFRDASRDCNQDAIGDDQYDGQLRLDSSDGEEFKSAGFKFTETGFQITGTNPEYNKSNDRFIWMAIRRPDGVVAKPVTDPSTVFNVQVGESTSYSYSSGFKCGFVPDFMIRKAHESNSSFYTGLRLTGQEYMSPDIKSAGSNTSGSIWTFEDGMGNWGDVSDQMGWHWKRHAGFQCFTFTGDGVSGREIFHHMGRTPEMIWVKRRDGADNSEWICGHKGANGGTNPWNYELLLHENNGESASSNKFNDTAPTDKVFTLGNSIWVNGNNSHYIALAFASVDGVSAIGSYDGSTSTQTIEVGFQPKFVLIKGMTSGKNWLLLDTTRGWGSGNDKYLYLDQSAAQGTDHDFGAPTSNGFSVTASSGHSGGSGTKFLYYAHA